MSIYEHVAQQLQPWHPTARGRCPIPLATEQPGMLSAHFTCNVNRPDSNQLPSRRCSQGDHEGKIYPIEANRRHHETEEGAMANCSSAESPAASPRLLGRLVGTFALAPGAALGTGFAADQTAETTACRDDMTR